MGDKMYEYIDSHTCIDHSRVLGGFFIVDYINPNMKCLPEFEPDYEAVRVSQRFQTRREAKVAWYADSSIIVWRPESEFKAEVAKAKRIQEQAQEFYRLGRLFMESDELPREVAIGLVNLVRYCDDGDKDWITERGR